MPVLNSICQAIENGTFTEYPPSLILLPTRELAIQVESVLKKILEQLKLQYEGVKINTCTISGGFSAEKQIRLLSYKPKVIIGTIGRMWDILSNNKSDDFKAIAGVGFLVLDEVDRIIDLGQTKELEYLLKYIDNP